MKIIRHYSQALDFSLRQLNSLLRGGYVRVFTQYLEPLPIRRISFKTPPERRQVLAEKGRALYAEYVQLWSAASASPQEVTQSLHSKLLEFVEEQLTHDPERSDVVHDLLAFLAEEMIRLNKEKQAEIKRFLGWLEQRAGIKEGLESLSGKTTVKNYLGDYQKNEPEAPFEKILHVLQKNRRKLSASLSDTKLVAELEKKYEASLAKLLPIKQKLALTDRLIDQIVYKLYGLTADETAIVENV